VGSYEKSPMSALIESGIPFSSPFHISHSCPGSFPSPRSASVQCGIASPASVSSLSAGLFSTSGSDSEHEACNTRLFDPFLIEDSSFLLFRFFFIDTARFPLLEAHSFSLQVFELAPNLVKKAHLSRPFSRKDPHPSLLLHYVPFFLASLLPLFLHVQGGRFPLRRLGDLSAQPQSGSRRVALLLPALLW